MAGALVVAAVAAGMAARAASPRFLPDDPIQVDDDRVIDASGVAPREDTNGYDFVVNTFSSPGERRDVTALNVNTVGEVPDSSWFTNRIGRGPMSSDELVRGPDRVASISLEGWRVIRDKGTGLQPGFRMADPSGHIWQIELDPPSNPEMATGAEIIGTAFYHAFGYHVVDVYLAELDPETLRIDEKATIRDPSTLKRRPMTRRDVEEVLDRGARMGNGKYRVLASRFADGKPLGNFRYYGTRPDDPNDIVAHEHRRELRGSRVFAAWLNHDDSRGVNSLDMLDETDGKRWVKHYMFDFGSIMGSGTVFAQTYRAGHEYIFEWKPGLLTLASLGFSFRPWILIDYPALPPSLGRFEADAFDPVDWKPEYPNPAFENMRPDDAFWAARIVSRFSDEAIRAIVAKARYSDPRATDLLTQMLVKRRDKVLRAWLTGVTPVVDARLDAAGRLTFENAAVAAGVATPAAAYTLAWFRFDNEADQKTPVSPEQSVTGLSSQAPADLLAAGTHIGVSIGATHQDWPGWRQPVAFYFRRAGSGWELVGIER